MIAIKICGMRRVDDIEAANALLPDYIGFVFAKSHRQVTLEQAMDLRGALVRSICAVGVFVNAPVSEVAHIAALCGLSAVQLHGDESGNYIKKLRTILNNDCEIWKAVRVKSAQDIREAQKTGADRLLLDAFCPDARGGTGKRFDWELIGSAAIDRPFFVAGGITSENVNEAIEAGKGAGVPFGIDVSGGVETDGYKDFNKMKEIIDTVRNYKEK